MHVFLVLITELKLRVVFNLCITARQTSSKYPFRQARVLEKCNFSIHTRSCLPWIAERISLSLVLNIRIDMIPAEIDCLLS
jgi:hypothetical protein